MAESSRDLVKQTDLLYKLACRVIDLCENECHAKESDAWPRRDVARARKDADEARQAAVEPVEHHGNKQRHGAARIISVDRRNDAVETGEQNTRRHKVREKIDPLVARDAEFAL